MSEPTQTALVTSYRPPKPNKDIIDEFSSLLTILCTLSPNAIVGDFNINMDSLNHILTIDFTSRLEILGPYLGPFSKRNHQI